MYKVEKTCLNPDCDDVFTSYICDNRKYCGRKCGEFDRKRIGVSPETRIKMSAARLGKKRPGVGRIIKEMWQDPVYKAKQMKSRSNLKQRVPKETRVCELDGCNNRFVCYPGDEKRHCGSKCALTSMWADPTYREKQLEAIIRGSCLRPTKPESILDQVLQRVFPGEYRYVGDGSFILGFKNPDFVNVNGQKKIIELFGDYWHSEEVTGVSVEEHERERVGYFTKYGYQTLIIWERELVDISSVKNKIVEFTKDPIH